MFIVKKYPAMHADYIKAHAHADLTGYKQPRAIKFRKKLQKPTHARPSVANCWMRLNSNRRHVSAGTLRDC
ncbi:hypothetical protein ABQU74_18620 [Xanthomonas sp. WHRI 10208]